MRIRIRSPKDAWAGLMFMACGLFALAWALAYYHRGTSVRIGPGYFPAALGALLAVLGLITFVNSLVVDGPKVPAFHPRPLLLILLACVVYGYLMKPLGLVLATVALVFISALGGHEFRWKEVLILCVVLTVFSVLVFVKALTLPFPLLPDALQRGML